MTALWILSMVIALSAQNQVKYNLNKFDYYNQVFAPSRGLAPLVPFEQNRLGKTAGAFAIRYGRLDAGNVSVVIQNTAVLGYSRWASGKCYEYPINSNHTYRWTMCPLIAAKIQNDAGEWVKRTAGAGYGTGRDQDEQEFLPLEGYHSGLNDIRANLGIAMSDISSSWPVNWPSGTVDDQFPVGSEGFKGIYNGEIRADREVYFAAIDSMNNNGAPGAVMGCRVDMWGLQWSDFLNRNFIIYKFVVTNVSNKEWKDVYIGFHDDPDCPEEGASEWTDDFAAFIPMGDPNNDSLLWNFSYLWDGDDYVEGEFDDGGVGWVGLKVLETPNDPVSSAEKGLTCMQVFPYSAAPTTESASYDQLSSGIMPPQNVQPHAEDWTQTPNSYGPDVTYAVASGPFDLQPGESLNFAIASIHGANKADLFNNAVLCQMLYNAQYQSAEAPPTPELKVVASEDKVTLYWDDRAENGIYYKKNADGTVQTDGNGEPVIDHVGDFLSGNNKFQGYKLFKSSDNGVTWGTAIVDMKGVNKGYIPLAQYDLNDDISGESVVRPFFDLGDNTGLRHSYVDNNVKNGYEYLYALVAYDSRDTLFPESPSPLVVPPIENSIPSDASIAGDNLVAVRPKGFSAGATEGYADSIAIHTAGNADVVQQQVVILDPTATKTASYEVTFSLNDYNETIFNVRNTTSNAWAKTAAQQDVVNWPFFDQSMDNAPIFDGIKIIVRDAEAGLKGYTWSGNSDVEIVYDGIYDLFFPHDYEFRWDPSAASEPGVFGAPGIPFRIYNKTLGQMCSHYLWDDNENGAYDAYEYFMVVESDDNESFTHVFYLGYDESSVMPQTGEIATVEMNKTISLEDKYQFSTQAFDKTTITANDLKDIRVVPNPYIFTSIYEHGKFGIEKQIQFHYLPPQCTIKIFNVAGNLLQTIHHTDGTPIEAWNLRTVNDQEISFGVYIYHIEAEGIGETIGKFAIIK